MTDTADTTQTAPDAGQAPAVPFDREQLFQRSMKALARFERLYDAARKRLQRAKQADDFLTYLIGSKRALIEKLLGMWYTPDDLADMLIEEIGDIPVERKKIVSAIQKCRASGAVAGDGSAEKKRRGRPPKSAPADTASAGQLPESNGGGSEIPEKIPEKDAGNSPGNSRNFSANFSQSSEKSTVQNAKSRTKTPAPGPKKDANPQAAAAPVNGASAEKQDTEERQQRLRQKAPTWVDAYSDDPKYGPVVARHDGESDADYFFRMWHTAPPWAGEQPRFSEHESVTQWIQKCWLLTSPEEREAHQASLPTTAR